MSSSEISDADKAKITVVINQGFVEVPHLRKITSIVNSVEPGFSLNKALVGSKLLFPTFSSPVENSRASQKEKEATQKRREYLQLRQQDREYNKMVYGQER